MLVITKKKIQSNLSDFQFARIINDDIDGI